MPSLDTKSMNSIKYYKISGIGNIRTQRVAGQICQARDELLIYHMVKINRIRNERIRGTTKVGEISKKVQENRFSIAAWVYRMLTLGSDGHYIQYCCLGLSDGDFRFRWPIYSVLLPGSIGC